MQSNDDVLRKYCHSIDKLQEIGQEILVLESTFLELELNMNIDLNYILKVFAMRAFQQFHAMFALKDNESHILIARSMFEGWVYLVNFIENQQLASDWRNYAYVIDQQQLDSTKNKDDVPEEVLKLLESNTSIINSFKNKKGKFYNSWKKDKTIKDLSYEANLEHYYNTYYSPMSEFHHWGVKSFVIRYECLELTIKPNISNNILIKLESFNAWCISITSILSILLVLSKEVKNEELLKKIAELQNKIKSTDNLKSTNIKKL